MDDPIAPDDDAPRHQGGCEMDSPATGTPHQDGDQVIQSHGPDGGPPLCDALDGLTDARCLLRERHDGNHWGHGPLRQWRHQAVASARLPAISEADVLGDPPIPDSNGALMAYMEAESGPERDAAFLRLFAAKVRTQQGVIMTWEIPHTTALTLEGIANRLLGGTDKKATDD